MCAGKFVFSVKDTLTCLEMGAVDTLIVWESLDYDRYELNNPSIQKVEVKYLTSEQVCKLDQVGLGGRAPLAS